MKMKIDFTFVVDVSYSINNLPFVKKTINAAVDGVLQRLCDCGREVTSYRARIVTYSDFAAVGSNAICQTDFVNLLTDRKEFSRIVNSVTWDKANGEKSCAMEAIFTAINSDWEHIDSMNGERGRHFVVLFTQKQTKFFAENVGADGYKPDLFPEALPELEYIWHSDETKLSPRSKRLVLFITEQAFKQDLWQNIASWEWCNVCFVDTTENLDQRALDNLFVSEIVRS